MKTIGNASVKIQFINGNIVIIANMIESERNKTQRTVWYKFINRYGEEDYIEFNTDDIQYIETKRNKGGVVIV